MLDFGLLYHFKRRGYRGFSMNRPDKVWNKLSPAEKEIGGIPNSGQDIIQAHAAAIESHIDNHVGDLGDGFGTMYFQSTLNDWARFDINNRTAHDASISSGLAIMACNKHMYSPVVNYQKDKVSLGFKKYDNNNDSSKIINR